MQRFKVSGFKSLVRSADLLQKVMNKLGVLDPSIVDVNEKPELSPKTDDIVQVVLGNAKPVFNSINENDDYYFFVRGISGLSGTSIINVKDNINQNNVLYTDEEIVSHKSEKVDNKDKVKLELFKYYNPKGPPIIC
jgi:hypothetical protein